eukprot:TRINITY_DN81740_c0_g1_i1.p1 TRINITY_DN81740_c0_g1~~TRINITY_DN81740_c0_g1_i1.p1  ORF type:complete len:287 (+),score=22.84 TRINITY_DN81740_c0_g1_i1:129-863(+)
MADVPPSLQEHNGRRTSSGPGSFQLPHQGPLDAATLSQLLQRGTLPQQQEGHRGEENQQHEAHGYSGGHLYGHEKQPSTSQHGGPRRSSGNYTTSGDYSPPQFPPQQPATPSFGNIPPSTAGPAPPGPRWPSPGTSRGFGSSAAFGLGFGSGLPPPPQAPLRRFGEATMSSYGLRSYSPPRVFDAYPPLGTAWDRFPSTPAASFDYLPTSFGRPVSPGWRRPGGLPPPTPLPPTPFFPSSYGTL